MNSKQAAHILITRINLRQPNPEWFAERLPLFQRYCLASVQAQHIKPTAWLLAIDKRTPIPYRKVILQDVPATPLFTRHETFVADVRRWIRSNISTPWIITTRLDSDDALHPLFLSDMQAASRPKRELLSLPHGWATYMGNYYNWKWHSAFVSLVEQNNDRAATVQKGAHDKLQFRYPYRVLGKQRRWLYVMHDSNLSGAAKIRQITKKGIRVPHAVVANAMKGVAV